VLLVDDDAELVDLLTSALRREGYAVLAAADGRQALAQWKAHQPDLVLLDLGLPKLDGLEVCRRIRRTSATPIIMLTGRDADADEVRGLEAGADDCVTKPVGVRQLAARMAAVLRRGAAVSAEVLVRELRTGDLVLDPESHTVTKAGAPVALTPLEFRVLYMLAMNAGRVVPYARLVEYAWGYCDRHTSKLLKAHITHVRHKLGLGTGQAGGIAAVVGVGYRLSPA
jgi:DNA-binding response OmpR family regulator